MYCVLHIKPFFYLSISSIPRVRADSSSQRDTSSEVTKPRHKILRRNAAKGVDNARPYHRTGYDRHNILYARQQPRYIERKTHEERKKEGKEKQRKQILRYQRKPVLSPAKGVPTQIGTSRGDERVEETKRTSLTI